MFTQERIAEIFFGRKKVSNEDIESIFELAKQIESICSQGRWMNWSHSVRTEFANQVIFSGEALRIGTERFLNILQIETWLGSSMQFNNLRILVKEILKDDVNIEIIHA